MTNCSKLHIHKNEVEMKKLFFEFVSAMDSKKYSSNFLKWVLLTIILIAGVWQMFEKSRAVRCILPNTYLVWEASRPQTDCNMCRNIKSVTDLPNVTREEFQEWAYTSVPVIVRNASLHWRAAELFSFQFLKSILESVDGAYQAVDEDCQLLTFKSEFLGLEQIFEMDEDRLKGLPGTKPWYVGWSFCQTELVKKMRQYYPRPHFLPEDAEHSHIDYVFMGYEQGAIMHLDYVSRLLWQAQLVGSKTWRLVPPPECQNICSEISFLVNRGDIVLIDTRQWYHDTKVTPNEFSLTVSSEYG